MPKRTLQGTVVKKTGDKSINVLVEYKVKHPLYGKIMKRSKKFIAHDEQNKAVVGDTVKIIESKPRSKRKTWELIEEK